MYFAGNVILRVYHLASMTYDYIMSICSKYNIGHFALSDASIKDTVHFD